MFGCRLIRYVTTPPLDVAGNFDWRNRAKKKKKKEAHRSEFLPLERNIPKWLPLLVRLYCYASIINPDILPRVTSGWHNKAYLSGVIKDGTATKQLHLKCQPTSEDPALCKVLQIKTHSTLRHACLFFNEEKPQ